MGWIAGKRMKIKRGRENVWVNPGDPVPEAETWPNRSAWERTGHIRPTRRGEEVAPVEVKVSKIHRKPRPPIVMPPTDPGPAPDAEEIDEILAADTDTKEEANPEPLTGPGECPFCEQDFVQLERHNCKKAPGYKPKKQRRKKR